VSKQKAEPVSVAKYWDDLRFVEKDKTELEIAGFLRNIFKYSVVSVCAVMVKFSIRVA